MAKRRRVIGKRPIAVPSSSSSSKKAEDNAVAVSAGAVASPSSSSLEKAHPSSLAADTAYASSSSSRKLYVICTYPYSFEPHIYSIYAIDVHSSTQPEYEEPTPLKSFLTLHISYPFNLAFAIFDSNLYLFGGSYLGAPKDDWLSDVYILDSIHVYTTHICSPLAKESLKKSHNMTGAKWFPIAVIVEGIEKICVFSSLLFHTQSPHFELFSPKNQLWLQLPNPPIDYGRVIGCRAGAIGNVKIESYIVKNSTLFISTPYLGIYSINLNIKEPFWTCVQFASGITKFPFVRGGLGFENICLTADCIYDVNTKSVNCLKTSFPIFIPTLTEERVFSPCFDGGCICPTGQSYFCTTRAGFPSKSPVWSDETSSFPYLQVDLIHHTRGKTIAAVEFRRLKTLTYRLVDQWVDIVSAVGSFFSAVD